MKSGGNQIALHLSGTHLCALMARAGADGVDVLACAVAERPTSVDVADAAAAGAWIGARLDEAGMLAAAKRGGVAFAAGRGEVAVKRILVPPGAAAGEVPGLVRLQMVRQLPVAGDEAAIDFVRFDDGDKASGSAAGAAVLAAALPRERLEWRQRAALAGGFRLARVGLLAEGAAWALRERAMGGAGSVMGLVLGAGAIELVVVEHGRLMFARAIDAQRPGPGAGSVERDAAAAAILVEARRTWMTYRVAAESSEIDEIVVMGDDPFAQACATTLGEGLEMPARTMGAAAGVRFPEGVPAEARAAGMALAGLIGQGAVAGGETGGFDFLCPRKAVDVGAQRRRAALAGVLASVLVVGSVYTWSSGEIAARESEASDLRGQYEKTRAEHALHLRERARTEFLQRFVENRADWVAHLNHVAMHLPDTRQAILDELRGSIAAQVAFDLPKDGAKRFANGKWRPVSAVTIEMSGSSKGRAVADGLRDRLQNDRAYKVETRGADVPNHFEYVLTTGRAAPSDAPASGGGDGTEAGVGAGPAERKEGGS